MKKTAIIYDKWLDSLGGGEMVACHMAKCLLAVNYDVTIICRKKVSPNEIKQKLDIDLSGVKFVEIWNDESQLKKITLHKDLFINISFIDYSKGYAKKNIYYAHFPTQIYNGIKGIVFNKLIIPIISKNIKPVEFINNPKNTVTFNSKIQYELNPTNSIAYTYLNTKKIYNLKFFIYHESVSKQSLSAFSFKITNSVIISQRVYFDHQHNVLKYLIKFKPNKPTVYFYLFLKNNITPTFLIEPHLYLTPYPGIITKLLEQKFYTKIRAGIFNNVSSRLNTYSLIIVHSKFVAGWVDKYWNRPSTVLYPPVEMLFDKKQVNYNSKKNYICSVGRFFTLGHSKKQDVMIKAFIDMCEQGLTGWELHLSGGLGNEPTSLNYFKHLKEMSSGYPIYFHINKSHKEILDLYYESKIYWHAAGFGQNKNTQPINFEHFGITPVEAMSAGCTPVLFNGGGLPEIIYQIGLDPHIHLFNTINELTSNTLKIINDNKLAIIDQSLLSKLFSINTFKEKFLKIVSQNE